MATDQGFSNDALIYQLITLIIEDLILHLHMPISDVFAKHAMVDTADISHMCLFLE